MSSLPVSRPKSKSLSVAERATLIRCERTAAEGMQQFVKVGNALAEIRDSHLYRETHKTFEQYVRDRWHLDPRHAYRQISAAQVATDLDDAEVRPATPWQCNPLVGVKDPEERREAWDEAVAKSGGEQPSNAVVKAVVERRTAERTVAELVQDVKDAGLVPEDATVTVVLPDPGDDEPEAEAEPETPRELTDAEWLETLPARSKLTGGIRDRFDCEALYYRHSEAIRRRFKEELRPIRTRHVKALGTPYVAKELRYFRLNHPGDWLACRVCNGNGIHAGLGQICPACHGAGYHIHDGGK